MHIKLLYFSLGMRKRRVRLRYFLLGAIVVVLALGYFGPAKRVKTTLYYSPVWSADATSIAYGKRVVSYTFVEPYIKLPFLKPSPRYNFDRDDLYLAINSSGGTGERTIKKFSLSKAKISNDELGRIEAKVSWYREGLILYNFRTRDFSPEFQTGNYFIRPDGTGEFFVSETYDPRLLTAPAFPTMVNNMELWTRRDGDNTIFLFDHSEKVVRVLLTNEATTPRLPTYRPPGLLATGLDQKGQVPSDQ